MDLMSANVNDERAPKGLTCPTITAVPDVEPADESCPLCGNPFIPAMLQERRAQLKGLSANSTENVGVKADQKRVDEITDAADRPGLSGENSTETDTGRRRAERSETTPIDKAAPREGKTVQEWSGDVVIRGQRRIDSNSTTSSSSRGWNMRSDEPHYLDP